MRARAHILVVDDDILLASWIARSLERLGHRVTCVETTHEAVGFMRAFRIDLAILDLHLPDGDGLQLCERIRDLGLPHTPVLLISGADLGPDEHAHAARYVDAFLPKPFSNQHLAQEVAQLLAVR